MFCRCDFGCRKLKGYQTTCSCIDGATIHGGKENIHYCNGLYKMDCAKVIGMFCYFYFILYV